MVCSVRRRNVTIFTMPSQQASVALRRASRRGFVGKSRSPLDGSSIASRQRPKLRLMLSQRAAYVGVCLSVATLSGLLGHDQPRQPLFGLCDAAMGGHISLSRLWLDCFGGVGRLGAGARRGETARHSTPALAASVGSASNERLAHGASTTAGVKSQCFQRRGQINFSRGGAWTRFPPDLTRILRRKRWPWR